MSVYRVKFSEQLDKIEQNKITFNRSYIYLYTYLIFSLFFMDGSKYDGWGRSNYYKYIFTCGSLYYDVFSGSKYNRTLVTGAPSQIHYTVVSDVNFEVCGINDVV